MISTPLPLSSVRTPPVSLLTTPPFQVCSFFMSIVGLPGSEMPMLVGVAHLLVHLRGVDDGLRRDAPDVEADAAHVLALDDGGLDLELTEPDSRGITTGAGADHDGIETLLGHGRVLPRRAASGSSGDAGVSAAAPSLRVQRRAPEGPRTAGPWLRAHRPGWAGRCTSGRRRRRIILGLVEDVIGVPCKLCQELLRVPPEVPLEVLLEVLAELHIELRVNARFERVRHVQGSRAARVW